MNMVMDVFMTNNFDDKWNAMFEKIKNSKYESLTIPLVILLLPVSQSYHLYFFLKEKIKNKRGNNKT